ncbi:MAG: YicC family protein [Nitrospinae bacterium]|nr:YicC family protein [Nitrospinota bacterium]
MTLRSMTGYGRGEVGEDRVNCILEIRSVNHRFLDMMIKLPRRLASLEPQVRQEIQKRFSRGRFELTLIWQSEEEKELKIDRHLARQYILALQELKAELTLAGEVRADTLAHFKEIFQPAEKDEDLEKAWGIVKNGLDQALDSLDSLRKAEGQALKEDIQGRIDTIERHVQGIRAQYPTALSEYHERLKERVRNLVQDLEVDPQRLVQEVAFFAERSDISEELTRLDSHLKQFPIFLSSEEISVGRTLDFLLQEIHREVNTLGTKAGDFRISQSVIAIKAELEKIREQVQNIE